MEFRTGREFFLADAYWLPPQGPPIGPMALEVSCQIAGPATRLRVRQSGAERNDRWQRYYDLIATGWEESLDALKQYLEHGGRTPTAGQRDHPSIASTGGPRPDVMPHVPMHSNRVLIVGGGVIGSSIAYHLCRRAFEGEVVVVERDPTYRRASSYLAMGGIRQQFSSPANIRLAQYSTRFYEAFDESLRTPNHIPRSHFRQRGYLFLGG